jgi:hypothetical protein
MKVNYLNNKDILKEIHKSKTTYCTFTKPEYSEYDVIVNHINEIPKLFLETTEEKIEISDDGTKSKTSVKVPPKALTSRATRLTKLSQEAELAEGKKPRSELATVEWTAIQPEDVIFRVMTWEHVPLDDSKKGKKVADYVEEDSPHSEYDLDDEPVDPKFKKYTRCNFPPFMHYKMENGELTLVGKSHWQGPLDTGHFSKDHGAMTKKLAHMFVKLCERYATRSNWRGYTYNDEMRAQALLQLSQIGLRFDEAKSDNPFAYYTAAITNSFTRVLNIEKRNQNIRDDILEINGLNPSYTRQGMSGGYTGGGDYDE